MRVAFVGLGSTQDLDQCHLKNEIAIGRNFVTHSPFAIREARWNVELPLVSWLHEPERLRPACDDLPNRKGRRNTAVNGTIEDGAIGERPMVMHLHRIKIRR